MADRCTNPLCSAELTEANRVKHRRVCKACWKAQKAESRRLSKLAKAETDPKLAEHKKTAFLDELLRNGGFVERAIRTVGTSRRFVNDAYNTDPNFAQLWDTIIELGNEAIESEIYRRAVQGHDKPLSFQGKLTGHTVKEFSDNLLMFLAKARMPARYRDLPQKGSELSEEELNTKLEQYLAKRTKQIGGAAVVVGGN